MVSLPIYLNFQHPRAPIIGSKTSELRVYWVETRLHIFDFLAANLKESRGNNDVELFFETNWEYCYDSLLLYAVYDQY